MIELCFIWIFLWGYGQPWSNSETNWWNKNWK